MFRCRSPLAIAWRAGMQLQSTQIGVEVGESTVKQELQRRIKEFDRRRKAQLNVKVIICVKVTMLLCVVWREWQLRSPAFIWRPLLWPPPRLVSLRSQLLKNLLPLRLLITPNSCIPYCTNPRHLALPPTHSLWQSDAHARARTGGHALPLLLLLMASCSRVKFKARGLAWRPAISHAELWKHRLHFCLTAVA